MKPRSRPMARIAALKAVTQRFSFLILFVTAFGLMVLGKVDMVVVDELRTGVTDAAAPVLDAISRPAATVADLMQRANELADLRHRNALLAAENETLKQYQQVAYRLEAENLSLRDLLNYIPATTHSFLTARVIADNSGAYVRSLAINLGERHGIRNGQAVLGGEGLIGRIVQTGDRSARILLLTDLNARIPVMLQPSGHRAILGGDNSGQPRLLYLNRDTEIAPGDRIVTSGHGGMFPAGLPVGTVASVAESGIRVRLFEDLHRQEFVRIVDFRPSDREVRFRPSPHDVY